MRIITVSILATVLFWGCANDKKPSPVTENPLPVLDSSLITDSSWGFITKNTRFADLQKIAGGDNVKDERICGAECLDSIDVTRVYPGTANEIIVYWKDSLYHQSIAFIETYNPGSSYHTTSGLHIGSSLNDLLKINGQKISFYGFDWDYGGNIQSYHGGTLDKSPVNFSLDLAENANHELLGDSDFDTKMPAVKKWLDKITISRISLSFYKEN